MTRKVFWVCFLISCTIAYLLSNFFLTGSVLGERVQVKFPETKSASWNYEYIEKDVGDNVNAYEVVGNGVAGYGDEAITYLDKDICAAMVSMLMGVQAKVVSAINAGSYVRLSYRRPTDGTEWKYFCRVLSGKVFLGTNLDLDKKDLSADFYQKDGVLYIKQEHSDKSETIKAFNDKSFVSH